MNHENYDIEKLELGEEITLNPKTPEGRLARYQIRKYLFEYFNGLAYGWTGFGRYRKVEPVFNDDPDE
jgi:hypothetical protein